MATKYTCAFIFRLITFSGT